MAVMPRWFRKSYGTLIVLIFLAFALLQIFVSEYISHPSRGSSRRLKFQGKIIDGHVVNFNDYDAADPRLTEYVKRGMVRRVTGPHPQYNLTSSVEDHSRGQSVVIDKYLGGKMSGYYVEFGAADGEKDSVSLFLEKKRNYNGLLVEPDPRKYQKLVQKGRSASTMQVCVQTNETTTHKSYLMPGEKHPVYIPCLWPQTILLSTGQKTLDLLSVDIKGEELNILKAIPFEDFEIRVFTVEFSTSGDIHNDVVAFMFHSGYQALHQFVNHVLGKTDIVFVQRDSYAP